MSLIGSPKGLPRLVAGASMIASAVALLIAGPLASAQAEVTLVEDGEARAAVVLPEQPEELEQHAADELVEHIELISGARLSIVAGEDAPDGLTPIRLGAAADASLQDAVRERGNYPDGFTLRVDDAGVSIRGLEAQGTLFGAYELLEQLGVRWYAPGDWGRVVPEAATVRAQTQETVQTPDMELRLISGWNSRDTPWYHRQRFGGLHRSTGSHNIRPFGRGSSGRRHFEENPEYYALVDGERRHRQICVSNPDVLEIATENLRQRLENNPDLKYVGMGPADGGGYCECENCRALDRGVYDPMRDSVSMTDRYIWFFNQMLDRLEDEHSDVHIVWYVYAAHMMPPEIDPNPRIVGVFAPIDLDRIRSMDNPMSPDRHVLRWLIDEWYDTNPNELYYRGYYNLLACPQFPFSQIDRMRNDIPALYDRGIKAMRVEQIRISWASNPISLYIAGRMMWDVDTDVDALLEEFYDKFYGPASGPMGEYHEGLEAAFRDTPHFAGSSHPYFPIFLDHPRRDRLRGLLEDALSQVEAADDPIYAERVRAIRDGYRRMDVFLDMIEARNNFDFDTAYENMQAYYELTDELIDQVLENEDMHGEQIGDERRWSRLVNYMELSERGGSYFNRFFASPIERGHERAVEQGELVAGLPDQWQFLTDPAEIGELAGYHRPGELGGNWQPIDAYDRTWSDQGLHYYKGVAWYRQKITVPEQYEGRPLYLWFSGVDEMASVWINGEFVGTSSEPAEGLPGAPGTFRPFDMPATNAVRFGEDNWVVVQIENRRLAEVGTGGLLGPAMFWAPHDPDWTPEQ